MRTTALDQGTTQLYISSFKHLFHIHYIPSIQRVGARTQKTVEQERIKLTILKKREEKPNHQRHILAVFKKKKCRSSLEVQLKLHTSTTGDGGSIPDQGRSHMPCGMAKKTIAFAKKAPVENMCRIDIMNRIF